MVKDIWTEKYRPTCVDEVVGQDAIISEFKAIAKGDAPMQNFLFYSREPGTGKTSLAYALAKEMDWQMHKFNASSKKQRGIEFIEEDVIPLSRTGLGETIIFLDEADRITPTAQDALKGVIEESTAYFILTCNDLNKVSPWLQSRCQLRTFKPIDPDIMERSLANICARESVEVDDQDIKTIVTKHSGDLRNAIGALQTVSYLQGRARQQFIQRLEHPELNAGQFLTLCFKHKNIDAAYDEIEGGDPRQSIRMVFSFAVENNATNDSKLQVIDAAIDAERDLIMGVDETIVLWSFCRRLCG